MSRRLFFLLLICTILLIPMAAAAARKGTVPTAADEMAAAIDQQILGHFGVNPSNKSDGNQHLKIRRALTISFTSAVNLNDLEVSNAAGRQISEEMARWFVQAGYRVQEIRKGKDIYFDPRRGEMLLTRDVRKLFNTHVQTEAVLAGTYVVSPDQVRYTMRLVHVPSNDILAMSTATINITNDLKPLLRENTEPTKVMPSIGTKLKK